MMLMYGIEREVEKHEEAIVPMYTLVQFKCKINS